MTVRITHFLKPGDGDEEDREHDLIRRLALSRALQKAATPDTLGPGFIGVKESLSHGAGPITLDFDFEDNEEESRAAVAAFLKTKGTP